MRIGANFPEKRDKMKSELFVKMAIVGAVLAVALIFFTKLLIFLAVLAFKNWIWILGAVAAFFLLKRFFRRKFPKP